MPSSGFFWKPSRLLQVDIRPLHIFYINFDIHKISRINSVGIARLDLTGFEGISVTPYVPQTSPCLMLSFTGAFSHEGVFNSRCSTTLCMDIWNAWQKVQGAIWVSRETAGATTGGYQCEGPVWRTTTTRVLSGLAGNYPVPYFRP